MEIPQIDGVVLIKNNLVQDERGYLSRLYDTTQDDFFLPESSFNSIAVLNKRAFTLRGMHYQVNAFEETKVAFCLVGKIFDVVIDLRTSSKTYLQSYYGYFGPEEEFIGLTIPAGCAHGYLTLLDNTFMIYFIDNCHSPENERGLAWDDPHFQIPWPNSPRVISARDKSHPFFEQK
jgi:dTDP-4-dehydrorhamnose 3,5-epimerase